MERRYEVRKREIEEDAKLDWTPISAARKIINHFASYGGYG